MFSEGDKFACERADISEVSYEYNWLVRDSFKTLLMPIEGKVEADPITIYMQQAVDILR